MRIWSLHPQHLDTKGLVALWREILLAKHVLEDKTKGYKNHPQLDRFKKLKKPVDAINHYLTIVYAEANERGFDFNKEKINWKFNKQKINVTTGQIAFEVSHLLKKLKIRDKIKYKEIKSLKSLEIHPLFKAVEGEIEDWEIIPGTKTN